jgi:hypothetical protein
VIGGLVGALILVGLGLPTALPGPIAAGALPGPAAAGLLGPVAADAAAPAAYATSAATRYLVTFAARSCASFGDVTAGQVRGDDGESLGRPGGDSRYQLGQAVDPTVEDTAGAGCTALSGVRFTLGSGHERTGRLSTVIGDPVTTTPQTSDSTPRLDQVGRDTGGLLTGSVTMPLTEPQVDLAARRQLWVQGGTPDEPVADGSAFGALRCSMDGRTGGNLQWLSFPAGVRHVFCYAYYVKSTDAGGRITVRLRTTRPIGYPQRVPFASTLSFSPDGAFVLASSSDPVDAAFDRATTPTGQPGYGLRPQPPSGWRVADATCTASRADQASATSTATVDPVTGTALVNLAEGDLVTCGYVLEPPAAPAGLSVRLFTPGTTGTFGVVVAASRAGSAGNAAPAPSASAVPGPSPSQPAGDPTGQAAGQQLSVSTAADGSAVTATGANLSTLASGRYTVSVAMPAARWSLAGAYCNGVPAAISAAGLSVDLVAGVPLECVLRADLTPPALRLNVVTSGDVATAAFAVVAVDGGGAGWWAKVNTTGYGVPAAASGDLPNRMRFGTYLVTAIPPASTVTSGWRLATLSCDPADPDGSATAGAAVRITLAPGGTDRTCTASYQSEATTRLQVTVQPAGSPFGRRGPAVVEVSCGDGSAGRVVVAAGDGRQGSLPERLAFLEPTHCTVVQASTGAGQTTVVKVSARLEPTVGDGPVDLPSQVDIAREVAQYTVAVTDEFGEPANRPRRSSLLSGLKGLPMLLVGVGGVGLVAVVALGVLLRRRVR